MAECPTGCDKPPPTENGTVDLSTVTCPCGFGYYKPDGTWISGDIVRAGRAPTKSGSMLTPSTPSEIPSQDGD